VLSPVVPEDLVPLPPPYDNPADEPAWKELSPEAKERLVCNLDGVVALSVPKPKDEAEEKEYVEKFRAGLKKLLEKNNNATSLAGLLRQLPELQRSLPRLHGQRPKRHLPADLQGGGSASAGRQVR
jgi:hypothetical protein